MLNNLNFETSWNSLRCKYKLKKIITTKKNYCSQSNCTLRKMGLKFQNPYFNILYKRALWNQKKWLIGSWLHGAGWPGKWDIWVSGTAWKNDKFSLQENFTLHGTKPVCFYHPFNRKPGRPEQDIILFWEICTC